MARVLVNLEELDLDTAALIEEAGRGRQLGMAELREIVARFLVEDNGTPLTEDEARKEAGRMRLREVKMVFEQLNAALQEVQQAAVPKATKQV